MTDFRALCAELVAALDPKVVGKDGYGPISALLPRARAALAEQPVGPTEELLGEIHDYYAALAARHPDKAVFHSDNVESEGTNGMC